MNPRTWPRALWALIVAWRRERRMSRVANAIAADVFPELWVGARRKLTHSSKSELAEYTRIRAGQLIHGKVDEILRADSRLQAQFGNRLLVRSVDAAVDLVASAAEAVTQRPRLGSRE
jgi:hypothetical protein